MSIAQRLIVIVVLAVVGIAAALAGSAIVSLTGSEAISPIGGALLGAVLGTSAGGVIGRATRWPRKIVDVALEVIVAGGMTALTLWFLQHR